MLASCCPFSELVIELLNWCGLWTYLRACVGKMPVLSSALTIIIIGTESLNLCAGVRIHACVSVVHYGLAIADACHGTAHLRRARWELKLQYYVMGNNKVQ